jgi:hypothetical protein
MFLNHTVRRRDPSSIRCKALQCQPRNTPKSQKVEALPFSELSRYKAVDRPGTTDELSTEIPGLKKLSRFRVHRKSRVANMG